MQLFGDASIGGQLARHFLREIEDYTYFSYQGVNHAIKEKPLRVSMQPNLALLGSTMVPTAPGGYPGIMASATPGIPGEVQPR